MVEGDVGAPEKAPAAGGTPPPGEGGEKPPAEKPGTPPPAKPGTPAAKPGDKPGEKTPATPPAAGAKPGDIPDPSKDIKGFRKWAENEHERAKTLEGQNRELQTQLETLKKAPAAPSPETGKLTTRITELEKQLGEQDQTIRFLNYQKSREYNEKYEAPYQAAVKRADRDIQQLIIEEKDPANPDGPAKQRKATMEDFWRLYQLPLGPRAKAVRELFGQDQAPLVFGHITKVGELAEAAITAVEEYKTKAKDHEARETAETAQQQQRRETLWKLANDKLQEKYPEAFGEDKDNAEVNDALKKGFALADDFFEKGGEGMTMEAQVFLHAQMRNRIAGFFKRGAVIKQLKAELEAKTKELEEIRGSAPGKREIPGGEAPGGEPKTWEEGINALPE